jgi:signal transduction histidine kinase
MSHCKRILLADDDSSSIHVLRMCLCAQGHEIASAATGGEALEHFNTYRPALVVIDVDMPDMSGIDVLRHIRSNPEFGETPVIVLTGFGERPKRLLALEAGANDYLEKPVDVAVLLARVRSLLRQQEKLEALRISRDEARAQNAELERQQRLQREFVDFIVHDFKGPITCISANAEWAYEELHGEHPAAAAALRDVLDGGRRLDEMTRELLLTSQMEQSDFRLNLRPVSLPRLLEHVLHHFRRAASKQRIHVLAPPQPDVGILVDRSLLQRVLENLLDNSLRYTPPGGRISVSFDIAEDVVLDVANTGPAVARREREAVFAKFRRGRGETAFGHSGLGLYFCRRVVRAHGGDICILETPEFPTCFRVQLPHSTIVESAPLSGTVPLARDLSPLEDSDFNDTSGAFPRAGVRMLRQR